MQRVHVDLGGRAYDVCVGAGLFARLADLLAPLAPIPRIVLVSDSHVGPLYADAVTGSLAAITERVDRVVIAAGEASKSVDVLSTLWDAILAGGADRNVVVVALGGGVVGDVAGFAAATALRGVRVVHLPTSLLAQVDSSVGGKTAINRPHGKNLVGAFKQPVAVIADVSTLATLPPRELRAGLAEAVKHAAILDPALWVTIKSQAARLLAADPEAAAQIVVRCCQLKAAVVAADEREQGRRRILNFGHTVGHAIERLSGYGTVLHGEAVAIGMVAAASIAARLGLADAAVGHQLRDVLASLGLPVQIPNGLSAGAIAACIAHDKKVDADAVAFVVCPAIGTARVVDVPLVNLPNLLGAIDGQ